MYELTYNGWYAIKHNQTKPNQTKKIIFQNTYCIKNITYFII